MYYLTKVQNKTTCACFAYATKDEAMAEFHTELAYRSVERTSTLCIVASETGAIIACDKYIAPPPAPTPDPEPEVDGDA